MVIPRFCGVFLNKNVDDMIFRFKIAVASKEYDEEQKTYYKQNQRQIYVDYTIDNARVRYGVLCCRM